MVMPLENSINLALISRHIVLCHTAIENGACAQPNYINMRKKYKFIPVHCSVISCPKKTKFAVQVLAYQRRLHTRFELNFFSHS